MVNVSDTNAMIKYKTVAPNIRLTPQGSYRARVRHMGKEVGGTFKSLKQAKVWVSANKDDAFKAFDKDEFVYSMKLKFKYNRKSQYLQVCYMDRKMNIPKKRFLLFASWVSYIRKSITS